MKIIDIDYISNDFVGVGKCDVDNRKYFIKGVLEGEKVEIINSINYKKYDIVTNYNIIKKSKKRCRPECEYFGSCGGCDLQYMSDDYYYEKKLEILLKKFIEICDNLPKITLFKVGKSKRRRVNLKYFNGVFGFYKKGSNHIIEIEKCINVVEEINNLLLELRVLKYIKNLKSLDISKVENGLVLNFIFSSKPKKEDLIKINNLSNLSYITQISYQEYEAAKVKILVKNKEPVIKLGNYLIELPHKFFMQATDISQNFMINTIINELKSYNNVLDLYSGIGTYSFPLSDFCNVYAYENVYDMVKKTIINIDKFGVKNLKTKLRDLNKRPLDVNDIKNFDAVILNPPRVGAEKQCKIIQKIKFKKIIYVSCNLDSLIIDMSYLLKNYKLKKLFLVDQFYWSKHIECICVLE